MQVDSLLRQTLGVKWIRVTRVKQVGHVIHGWLKSRAGSRPRCSVCRRKCSGYDTRRERCWRYVRLWGVRVNLHYRPRRVDCPRCGQVMEEMPWSCGKSPLSLQLVVFLAQLARLLPWQDVSRLTGEQWNTVRAAVRLAVDYGLAHRDTSGIFVVGVDEISRRKGQTYQTNVYDLQGKRLVWTGAGRNQETLMRFFEEWGPERCKHITAICCDMWDPYINIIKKYAPAATLVFDKFHIVQHLCQAIDKVRKEEVREKELSNPEVLAGTKYIWLKNPENLTDKQRIRLGELEKLNLKINRAYLLKEAFKRFWDYSYPACAEKYLDEWCRMAMHSRLKPLQKFVKMVQVHRPNIMTHFRYQITNAVTEGLNRKAKVISTKAYGFRTSETYGLALMHVMGDLPLPPITHRFL